jgi:hypothetical protein
MDPFARKMLLSSLAFGSAMVLMAAALSVVYFHAHPPCSEQVLSELASPDRRWVASVMQRRCGDESPFLLHINLRPATQPLRLGFFSGRANDGEVFLGEQEDFSAVPNLHWDSPAQLTVDCPGCSQARVKTRLASWGPVTVRYQISER